MKKPSSCGTEVVFIATRTVGTQVQPPTSQLCRESLCWIRRVASCTALTAIVLTLLTNSNAAAVSFSFKKVVDTDTRSLMRAKVTLVTSQPPR